MIVTFLLLAALLSAGAALFPNAEPKIARGALIGSTLVGLLCFVVALPVLFGSEAGILTPYYRVDGFSALLLLIIGFIQWTTTLVSIPYLREELHEKIVTLSQVRTYYALIPLFVLSMILAVVSNNLGIMWVALEGTTLATTMLVAFYTKEGSLEAAWKYIVLCSVGISLGLLGVLLVFFTAVTHGHISAANGVTWSALRDAAHLFNPSVMRWAFIFIFIGYGAKVGLVPMHTWLPDAHGRTPSPVSAMLSGVLLNVALFAILRYKSIVDITLGGSTWSDHFFLFFGALSFIVPAAFIVMQRNYKRLLAYSSIEHMGFTVFAFGFGVPGAVAGLIHMMGHALTKSMLFFGTGNILLRWKSTKIEAIGQVSSVLPYTAAFFLVGIFALLGTPPSPIFLSEYLALTLAAGHHPWVVAGMLFAGAVIFAGMIWQIVPMLYGKKASTAEASNLKHKISNDGQETEKLNLSHLAMGLHLVGIIVLGLVFLSTDARAFLERLAASIV